MDATEKILIETLETCHKSLMTYGGHPIIDNQVKAIVDRAKSEVSVEAGVMQKITELIDKKIIQEGIKHDNTMFSIKKEALEYFHQLYEFKIDFLKELKQELVSNFSA